jgi:Flp pilus assembly protein TadG
LPILNRRSRLRPAGRPIDDGQSLVEFALVAPIFLLLMMGLIEFAFLMNGLLSINYASRDAALVGAEAGNAAGADCQILRKVELDVSAPASAANITEVQIYRTNSSGQLLDVDGNVTSGPGQAVDTYSRTGATTCTLADGTSQTVPYTLVGTPTYPDAARCNDIEGTAEGCQAGHPGLDTIGVSITYHDTWRTPLHALLGLLGGGWTVTQSNPMRLEPVL